MAGYCVQEWDDYYKAYVWECNGGPNSGLSWYQYSDCIDQCTDQLYNLVFKQEPCVLITLISFRPMLGGVIVVQ